MQKRKENSNAHKVLKDLRQRKGIDWPETIEDRWVSLEHLFGRDVQKTSLFIGMPRRIEEEGEGRLRLQQVIHMLISKLKRPLFRPVLRRRRDWTLSLLLWETEASSAREEENEGFNI